MLMRRILWNGCTRNTFNHVKHNLAATTHQTYRIPMRYLQQRNDVKHNDTTHNNQTNQLNNHTNTTSPAYNLTASLSDIMKHQPDRLLPAQSINYDATLLEALNQFVALPFSSLPLLVMDDDGGLIGMITQRDIIDQIVDLKAANQKWSTRSVTSIMTKARDMACLNAQDTLDSCLTLMVTGQLHYLPFIERDTVVGFLSLPAIVASAFLSNAQPQSIKPAATRTIKDQAESSKAMYLRALKPHLGIPRNTKVKPLRSNATSSLASKSANKTASHTHKKPYLRTAQYQLPHPHKVQTGGEDFIVVCDNPVSNWSAMAVFDGVGSWSFEQGVDVRLFSKAFSEVTHTVMQAARSTSQQAVSPAQLLSRAWEQVQKLEIVGSCTACVMTIEPHKENDYATLRSISVGDSGYIVLRPRSTETQNDHDISVASIEQAKDDLAASESSGDFFPISTPIDADGHDQDSRFTVHYRSTQQLHYFNCPYQLGLTKTGEASFDRVEDGTNGAVQLMHGDIVLLSTDGLFDNLHESTILEIVDKHITSSKSSKQDDATPIVNVAAVAKSLGDRALIQSWDRSVDSPFALLAKEHNIQWGGGRRDDVSVIALQYDSQ